VNQSPKTDVLTPSGKAAPVALKLVVVEGPDHGAELVLSPGTYRIGKEDGNDLVLKDSAVSRLHLSVAVLEGGVRFTDEGSTNGSFCAGMRFSMVEASAGSTVRIGRSVLKLLPQAERAGALKPSSRHSFGKLVGQSLRMREVFALLEKVAASDSDVLVQGETGTGKDLCAQALHAQGRRAKGPLVVFDLAAVAPTLIESELFGHVKGAFTGAQGDRDGAFVRAHGGTLFLDEVGELPPELQPRLLRALEQRQVKPLGGNEYRKVDVRVIAATHRSLEAHSTFRRDLFHRLAVVQVELPPLRERPDDIPLLIDNVLEQLGRPASALTPETRAILCDYGWPGNVRELRNVVERVVTLGADAALDATKGAQPGRASLPAGRDLPFKEAKERIVESFERDYLEQLLRKCDWNLSKASREAGIARFYLRQLVKKHGLEKPE